MRFFKKFLNPRSRKDGDFLLKITQLTGIKPNSAQYYRKAFRHSSSISPRNRTKIKSNERLEFLGDAILDAVISEYLFKLYPNKDEGFLTQTRSKLVSRKHLNFIGEQLELSQFIESNLDNMNKVKSLLGNTFEALIGAIYLDCGYEASQRFILERVLEKYVRIEELNDLIISYTSKLYEWIQKEKREVKFIQEEMRGPLHAPIFHVKVIIDDEVIGYGSGDTKKKAKEEGAKYAYKKLVL